MIKAMRERQEAEHKAMIEKLEAAMQAIEEDLELEQAEYLNAMSKRFERDISAAMHELNTNAAARRVYHEAPDDVFELVVLQFPDVYEDTWGMGGLNAFLRLVSKRCLRVVESVATRLTHKGFAESLPRVTLKRCKRIEHIRCHRLKSLEGCPDGLKSLYIEDGQYIESLAPLSACKELESLESPNHVQNAKKVSDLSPLSSCTRLKKLNFKYSGFGPGVTDLTPLSSLPLLEEVDLSFASIKDVSPLSHCIKLKKLNIASNKVIKDLSPLCQCPDLEVLNMRGMAFIEDLSFFEEGFTKLRVLNINYLPVEDLSPLTRLQNLEELNCWGIPLTTSLLPLARCCSLKQIMCYTENAMDLAELREKRPYIEIIDNYMYQL